MEIIRGLGRLQEILPSKGIPSERILRKMGINLKSNLKSIVITYNKE